MTYCVKAIKVPSNIDAIAIEKQHYPSDVAIERRSSLGDTRSTGSNSSNGSGFVRATLALLPGGDKKNAGIWKKTKAALGYSAAYEILLIQKEQEDKEPMGHFLYYGNDASEALDAFEKLNDSMLPLLRDGSVFLTEALLKEIVLPKPLSVMELSFRLVEVMEADPRAHPEWHKVLQVLLHSAYTRENKDEIKFLLKKRGSLSEEDNKPIHTSTSKDGMDWLLSIAVPSEEYLVNREGLSPLNIVQNTSTAKAMMIKHAMPQSKTYLDLYSDVQIELHEAVDEDNSNGIWEYCKKTGLTSVHVRGRRSAVDLKKSPLARQMTVDVHSSNGLTPLILAIQKQYVKSTLFLLVGGADSNQHHPETGDTPLHFATKVENITLIKMLLCFGADPTLCNHKGVTSLQLASSCKSPAISQILEEIAQLQEKTWNYFINHFDIPEQKQEEEIYLLAMDGGGVRSFNTCQTMIAIEDRMKQLQPKCSSFFSYFDYVAGTSAGAIVALISAYTDAHTSLNRALTYKIVTDVFALPKSERANLMEKCLKEMVGEDTTMSYPIDQRVIITTTLADCSPSKLHLMTNYGPPRDGQVGPSERKVWEAGRASSAAPYFFPTFQGKFLDGGLMANNPTLDAIVEIHSQAEKEGSNSKIGCVVSLGTGYTAPKAVDNIEVFIPGLSFKTISSLYGTLSGVQSLLDLFVTQVTQSDGQEVLRSKMWCKSMGTPYYRLSPLLQEEIDPLSDDEEAIINMLYETQKYNLDNPDIIDSIAKCLLMKKQKPLTIQK